MTLGNVHEIVDGFARMSFPNCVGERDSTYIPILATDHLASKYINCKGYFSMVLQELVDYQGHFADSNTGWSRKVHDAHIFWNTGLFRKLQVGLSSQIRRSLWGKWKCTL